jgi:hypothetical protein
MGWAGRPYGCVQALLGSTEHPKTGSAGTSGISAWRQKRSAGTSGISRSIVLIAIGQYCADQGLGIGELLSIYQGAPEIGTTETGSEQNSLGKVSPAHLVGQSQLSRELRPEGPRTCQPHAQSSGPAHRTDAFQQHPDVSHS